LAPFRNPRESLAVLEHFCASGAVAKPLNDLFCALRRAAAAVPAAPFVLTQSSGTGVYVENG
jgi:hypothetical protein